MALAALADPEFDLIQELLLEVGQQKTCADVLSLAVNRFASQDAVVLARIWLVDRGDICTRCPMRDECPNQTSCLHLVASAGNSQVLGPGAWSSLDGDFQRFPLGVRKVGQIASTGEALCIPDIGDNTEWLARPEWAKEEGIRAFCGQPLVHRGEVLGVMGVFRREPIPMEHFAWHRLLSDHIALAIANARAFEEIARLKERLELENAYLREEVSEAQEFGSIVGNSAALRTIEQQIELVAPTEATVLILGESGTGKELVAHEIHARSARAEGPLVRVNCASIPRELYESEFFGHVQGAFTGAIRDRVGRFELANGGTLLLDEVGEIPLELQGKLLRVLQEGQYERVGDDVTRNVDVRVLTATNRNLKDEVAAGRFRQDLYYRLNVFPLEIPPLRERLEDVPILADHFLELAAHRMKRPRLHLTQANVLHLQQYDWPGNVRELQNVIERAVITAHNGVLRFELSANTERRVPGKTKQRNSHSEEILTEAQMRQRERDNILAALEATNWKVSGSGGTADLLGLKPTTLASRMKRFDLRRG